MNKAAKKTVFGHRFGTQAGRIDEVLLCVESTASLKEIALQAGVKLARVKGHLFKDINTGRRTDSQIARISYADADRTRVKVNWL